MMLQIRSFADVVPSFNFSLPCEAQVDFKTGLMGVFFEPTRSGEMLQHAFSGCIIWEGNTFSGSTKEVYGEATIKGRYDKSTRTLTFTKHYDKVPGVRLFNPYPIDYTYKQPGEEIPTIWEGTWTFDEPGYGIQTGKTLLHFFDPPT